MIPEIGTIDVASVNLANKEKLKTQTFEINLTDNFVGGKIDGLVALKQSIYLLLNTEADQHIIYPYTYGLKTLDLIGKPSYYVEAVLPKRIKEALLSDPRITDVSEFEFETIKNKTHCKFVVTSIYGGINGETEVTF